MHAPFIRAQFATHKRISEHRKIVAFKLHMPNPFATPQTFVIARRDMAASCFVKFQVVFVSPKDAVIGSQKDRCCQVFFDKTALNLLQLVKDLLNCCDDIR